MIKRILLWFMTIIVVLVAAIVLAFRFTPWPSVAIIQQAFSRGAQASEAALEKHVPSNIVTRRDVTYGNGPDEKFDVSYPELSGVVLTMRVTFPAGSSGRPSRD